MALIYVDGFEHYGGLKSNQIRGTGWTGVTGSLVTTFARTGDYSFYIGGADRFIFGESLYTVGIAMGIYFDNLPTTTYTGFAINRADGNPIITLQFRSDGSITVRKGPVNATTIAMTDSVFYAGTFNHFEMKLHIDSLVGALEIRVNGVQKLFIENLNLGLDMATACETISGYQGNAGNRYYIDDFILWDDTGEFNNDFLGPQRVLTVFPVGDSAEADWSINGGAGPGYDTIDELSQDGDATYLRADTVGQKSAFSIPELPTETIGIRGVFVPAIARIDEAGIGNIKVSMVSDTDVLASTEQTLTPAYTYTRSVFEYDPATGLAWTKAGVEAALIRVEKSL